MKKSLLLILLLAVGSHLQAADYYWVGAGGNWSDLNHWRLGSSGGSIPSIVPSSGDNVFFDANSGFTAGSKTVTLDANGFCNNMTWGAVANSPTFSTANVAFKVQLSGSLSLSPTTTYNVVMNFKGATAATLTSNGTVLGQLGIDVDKTGGSLTVTDSLIVPSAVTTAGTNGFILTSGTFDISGKKMTVYSFNSENTNVRTLEMTNATLNAVTTSNSGYVVNLINKTINATGSTIVAGAFRTDGGIYNRVTASTAAGQNTIIISNTTFKSLTFTPFSGGTFSDIGNGNTVDTLVFNGQGYIGSNNTIGSVRFAGVGTIGGTGNIIRSITTLNTFDVSGNFTNTVDSVMLAANRTATFRGTFNINKYFYVPGASCDAFTEISGDSTAGTLNFASGAVVDINNVILTGMKATGPGIPFAVNGVDGGGNAGFTITEPSGTGTTLYWVGGSGDWNNKSHWSFTSGGTGGACIPFKNDNVVFDANSGLASATVTTSSTSFCNNITWVAGVGTMTFSESATSSFRVYGSAVLQPNVTMNAALELNGTSAATLTTNGSGTGGLGIYVLKTGSGSVTLADNWINPAGGTLNLSNGTLSLAGRTVSVFIFTSSNGLTRNLDISNATITTNLRWQYLGANKTMTSTGSHLTAQGTYQVNGPGSSYPWVDLTEIAAERFYTINGTTFGQLTFINTSATSGANIVNGNTIRRLEFKGAGAVTSGSNNIDSLILAGSRNYTFAGTNTINKYFKAQATPCAGLTEIRGNTTGTLAFGSTAVADMANIYLQNMTATGSITPIAFNGADAGGNTGWTINSATGAPRYWVGGFGDWNDPLHWSATSGGAGNACVPTVYDDVYFDAGSGFTAVSKTVTVNNGNAYARNINWTGAANSPIWSKSASWAIEIWGDSILLNPTATFNTSPVTVKGATATFLKGTVLGNFDVSIDKQGGSLTVLNNYNNTQTDFGLVNGTFNASGLTLNVSGIDNIALNNVSGINISNSNITAGTWRYSGTIANHTLNAANASITAGTFTVNGLQYDTVNVSGILNTSAAISAATINKLTFTDPNTASAVGINGTSNTLGIVEYKGAGGIYGTGNVINTLIFFPGNTYTLTAGTTTTITDAWYGSGTPCRATEILSSSTTANATITKTGAQVNFDYVRLRRITATGSAAPFAAQSHSTDLGNNVSWNIAPYNGAAPIYGLGPDTAILPGHFPHTLYTDGFFGAPGSQYTWNNNSTADTLRATGPGTYSVAVSFPDGCSISDTITLSTLVIPLPVTLVSFTASANDCQSVIKWKVADASNFSHFVVERSTDGQHFTAIADILYTDAIDYTYSDKAPVNGTNYYRLKLVDLSAQYAYSKIVSTNTNCRLNEVKVYPTITTGAVQVVLPQGYSEAKIELHNSFGQQINKLVSGSDALRTISLDGLPDGIYILKVINGNESKSFKIRKQ
jgi:hypothetical protein